MVQAFVYYENEKFGDCIKEINSYKKNNYIEPDLKFKINLLLAECYINEKDYLSAEKEIDELIYSGTQEKQYELSAHFFKAAILLAFDRYEELGELLVKIKKEYNSITDDWYLDYNRALICFKKTDYLKAVEILNGLKSRNNSDDRKKTLNLIYGEIYFAQNKFKTAFDYYNAGAVKNDEDPYLSYKKALSLFNMNRYDEAVFELNKKVKTHSEKLLFLRKYLQSLIFLQQSKFADSINSIENLKEYEEFNFYPELRLSVSMAYYFIGKFEAAENEILKFFKQYPETALKTTAQKILIDIYIGAKKYDKCLKFIDEIGKSEFIEPEYLSYKKISVLFRMNNANKFMSEKNEYFEKFYGSENIKKLNLLSGLLWFVNGNYSLCVSDLSKIPEPPANQNESGKFGEPVELFNASAGLMSLSYILSEKTDEAVSFLKKNKNKIESEKYKDYAAECFNLLKFENIKKYKEIAKEIRVSDFYLITGRHFNSGAYGDLIETLDSLELQGDKKNEILIYYKAVDFFMSEKYDKSAAYLNTIISNSDKLNSGYVNKARLLLSEIYGKLNYPDSSEFHLKNMTPAADEIDIVSHKKLKKIDSMINSQKYYGALIELKSIESENIFCLYNRFIVSYKTEPESSEKYLIKMINLAPRHNLTLKSVYFYSKYLTSINKKSLAAKLLSNNEPAEGFEIPHYSLLYKICIDNGDKQGAEKILNRSLSALKMDKSVLEFILKRKNKNE